MISKLALPILALTLACTLVEPACAAGGPAKSTPAPLATISAADASSAGAAMDRKDDSRTSRGDDPKATLRSYADKYDFMVGSVIQRRFFNDPGFQQTLGKEFNYAVSIVFPQFTEPERGRFEFRAMDMDMAFAREHNMKLMGHALIYRNNNPMPWLNFQGDPRCGGWSEGELSRILHDHIVGVVRHGGDTYGAWEVVNEPTAQGGNGCWSRILGTEGLIVKAFKAAREAAPNTTLILNDTFGQEGVNRDRVDTFFSLVDRCKAQGAPIDMVGVEMHIEAHRLHPGWVDEFKYYLSRARKSGVKVFVSEMDLYQGPQGSFADPWENQRNIFYTVARTCLDDSNCKGFFTWGIGDKMTWLHDRPNNVIPDAKPLMFDDDYNRKPAYYGVQQALREGRR